MYEDKVAMGHSRCMRVLRVAQNLYPEVPGGGSYHVHAMSRDQAEMGHDVTVLTVSDDDSLPRVEEREGYRVVRKKPSVTLLGNEISVGACRFLKDAADFDVMHAHSHLYFSTNVAAVKKMLDGVPLAVTNHGLYSQSAPKWMFDIYLRTLGRVTLNRADTVFSYTEADGRRIREFGVKTDIEVVSNGIDTERFTPQGEKTDLIEGENIALFVGRLVKGKRPQDAVKAVSKLDRAGFDIDLYIVGEGPMRSELEEMSGDETTFLGRVPYDDMPKIYRSGDVLVLPSRSEGLPRTVLEAFASKLPVVSSNLEHISDIVQQGGETVEVGDIDGYSDALKKILDDPYEKREQAREVVEEKYGWKGTVEETTEVLSRISKRS